MKDKDNKFIYEILRKNSSSATRAMKKIFSTVFYPEINEEIKTQREQKKKAVKSDTFERLLNIETKPGNAVYQIFDDGVLYMDLMVYMEKHKNSDLSAQEAAKTKQETVLSTKLLNLLELDNYPENKAGIEKKIKSMFKLIKTLAERGEIRYSTDFRRKSEPDGKNDDSPNLSGR